MAGQVSQAGRLLDPRRMALRRGLLWIDLCGRTLWAREAFDRHIHRTFPVAQEGRVCLLRPLQSIIDAHQNVHHRLLPQRHEQGC